MTDGAGQADSLLVVTQEQRTLLSIVGDVFGTSGRWPVFQYVEARMFDAGLEAEAVVGALPSISHMQLRYAPVRYEHSRTAESAVKLTIAGFANLPDHREVVNVFLTVLRALAERRARADYDPHQVIEVLVSGHELLAEVALSRHPLAAVLPDILNGEPATWHGSGHVSGTDWQHKASPFLRRFQDVTDVGDYLRRLRAFILPAIPATTPTPTYVSPLGLPAAFDHLNTVWRLRFGDDLLAIPGVERSARLAFEVSTAEEFDNRLSGLGEMLKAFDPPGDERAGSLQRLGSHLRSHLTAEAMTRIQPALKTLRGVTNIRNAGQHIGAATTAATALPTLGLTYPITDFDYAWQIVRARVTQALDIIREEVYASVPPRPRRRSSWSGTRTPHPPGRPHSSAFGTGVSNSPTPTQSPSDPRS